MVTRFIQTKKTTLSYGINDSATTIQLENLLNLNGDSLVAGDLGTILYGTFAPGTSREEIFSIDGTNATFNADGTVTITSVVRGLKAISPYDTGGYSTDHGAGEIVIFGNNPQIYDAIYDYINAAVVAGGVPATDAVPGISIEATQAQVDAGTTQEAYNATNYDLFVRPDRVRAKKYHDAVASATGTDAYAITVVPAITAYAIGDEFTVIADVANTGACTLDVCGLGAKDIKKDVSTALATGDILAGQTFKVVYDGTNMQMVSKTSPATFVTPVVNVYTPTAKIGSSTTRFDITNISGNTYRYFYDGTGTDPNINATTFPVGSTISFYSGNFSAGNNGFFVVTGSGANYVEVTNASGVAENDKTIGTAVNAAVQKGVAWTKPTGLKYIIVEVQAGGGQGGGGTNTANGGGAGGGAGGYARKLIAAGSLADTEYYVVGVGHTYGGEPASKSIFSTTLLVTAFGGTDGSGSSQTGGYGGTATGGDINIRGGGGDGGYGTTGAGGDSPLATGGYGSSGNPGSGNNGVYGGGGGGTHGSGIGTTNGGDGGGGVIILTEYYE